MKTSGIIGGIGPESTTRRTPGDHRPLENSRGGGQRYAGGTELSVILREPMARGLPVLDTTQIDVDAAVQWILGAES